MASGHLAASSSWPSRRCQHRGHTPRLQHHGGKPCGPCGVANTAPRPLVPSLASLLRPPLSELPCAFPIRGIISFSASCAGCLDVSRQLSPLPAPFSPSSLSPRCSVAFLHLPDCLSAFYLGAGAPGAVILRDSTERFTSPLRLDNYQILNHVGLPSQTSLPSCQRRRSHLGNNVFCGGGGCCFKGKEARGDVGEQLFWKYTVESM